MKPVPGEGLDAFRQAVLDDPELQAQLLATPDRPLFVAAVVERARDRGFDVSPDDVEEALRDARREWTLRWI